MDETSRAEDVLLRALGKEIRALRIKRGLSRAELARAVGVSETTMGRIERSGPSDVGDSWQLARALRTNLADLVQDAEVAAFAPPGSVHDNAREGLSPDVREQLLVSLGYESSWDPELLGLTDADREVVDSETGTWRLVDGSADPEQGGGSGSGRTKARTRAYPSTQTEAARAKPRRPKMGEE